MVKLGCASLLKGGILPGNNLSDFSFHLHLFQQSLLAEAFEDTNTADGALPVFAVLLTLLRYNLSDKLLRMFVLVSCIMTGPAMHGAFSLTFLKWCLWSTFGSGLTPRVC